MRPPLIKVSGLSKSYNPKSSEGQTSDLMVHALDNFSASIEQGDFVAITGPSGSGKSTLMQILGLLDRADSGIYEFLGKDIQKMTDDELSIIRCHHIGFVFQSFNLLSKYSAFENVELPMIYGGKKNRKNKCLELLKLVGLEHRTSHSPFELSGGQQQRVAIARSLANQPPVIFADEPTGNLNQESANEIIETFHQLNKSGVTVILVTHDPNIANKAKRVISIVDGKMAKDERLMPLENFENLSLLSNDVLFESKGIERLIFFENLRMAFKSLLTNRLRSVLSCLGIIIGVASVIAMLGLGQGAQKSMEDNLQNLGSNVLSIRPESSKVKAKGASKSSQSLTLLDAKSIKDLSQMGVPVARVAALVQGSVQASRLDQHVTTSLIATTLEYETIYSMQPELGRFFTEEEDLARERLCLIGKSVYESLFPDGISPLNAYIKINKINFKIIGVLPEKGGSMMGDKDDVILIPLQTGLFRVFGKTRPSQIVVQVSNYEEMDHVIAHLENLLRRRHKIDPGKDEDDFYIRNMADIQQALSSTTKTMTLLLSLIAAISLLVGGIGIMNIMLVSVKERTREIGLRKALGAKNRHVLMQFLIESIVISAFGGLLGVLLGAGFSFLMAYGLGWIIALNLSVIFSIVFFSSGVGVLFGYWPARQASLLSPLEALRQ